MTALACAGCGRAVADDAPWPFTCPDAGDGRDHVVARAAAPAWPVLDGAPAGNPFVRYRALTYPWQLARARGLGDDGYLALVAELDRAVARVDGRGFAITPYRSVTDAGGRAIHAKDETGHVAGSHKARHLFGLALWLTVAERTGLVGAPDRRRPLAIASCGNAALAAAVVARALDWPLTVFVPPSADPPVIARLTALGATLVVCPRRAEDPPGDPCFHRFTEAIAAGAVPFSCQGSANGLTVDGGVTLGLELAEQDAALGLGRLDHVAIQVGGGALASAVALGLTWAARARGGAPPAVHPVQTAACFPLVRAWRRIARALAAQLEAPVAPAADDAGPGVDADADAATARWLAAHAPAAAIAAALTEAATHRAAYMWPWETAPHSVASGILDDETYDWLAIVRATLATGGWPIVVDEAALLAARGAAHAAGVQASATGAAGLAGVAALSVLTDPPPATARIAALLTGVER